MTWLSEIEDKNRQYRSKHKFKISPYEELPTEIMARVIRELVGHIKDVKVWAECAGIYLADGVPGSDSVLEEKRMKAYESYIYLSEDAKGLVDGD